MMFKRKAKNQPTIILTLYLVAAKYWPKIETKAQQMRPGK